MRIGRISDKFEFSCVYLRSRKKIIEKSLKRLSDIFLRSTYREILPRNRKALFLEYVENSSFSLLVDIFR